MRREQDDRVDRAHLGIDRDRLGTGGGGLHQGQAGAARTGEAHRLDARVGDQRGAEREAGLEDDAEHAGGQIALADGRTNGGRDHLGRAGMGRVRLDDHRAAGGKRRGGVATGHRKGEREVRRAEHRHRADRDVAEPQVDARQRLALGHRRVDAGIQKIAVAHHAGEQAELAAGAAALALEPGARQAALGHHALDQGVAELHDLGRDRFQEGGARLERGLAVDRERGRGGGAEAGDVGGGGGGDGRLDGGARAGIDGMDEVGHVLRNSRWVIVWLLP